VPVDQSLAELSDTLFSITVAIYSVAVVAFSAQLAFGRRPARELVAAGVGSGGVGPGDDAAPVRPQSARWGLIGVGLTAVGAVVHTAVLVTRGTAAGRLPWGNMYEFATAVVLVGVAAFLVLAVRVPGVRTMGAFVLAPVVLSLVAIGLFLYAEAGPLVAALRSSWLAVHVSTAIIGFGVFFVSGIASVLYLLRVRLDARGEDGGTSVLAKLPAAATLDRVAHRTIVFGFPIWTFAIIAGAIWAESAWGRFWGWDPKETWAFIAWVVYAGYLHARTTAGWRGRPAAWVNVVGLVVMVFNLLYVNMVSTGLHSYAGVN
jgi:cytochrome c-type biogenesis protein CcsB